MEHETLKETTVSDGRVEDRVGSVVDMVTAFHDKPQQRQRDQEGGEPLRTEGLAGVQDRLAGIPSSRHGDVPPEGSTTTAPAGDRRQPCADLADVFQRHLTPVRYGQREGEPSPLGVRLHRTWRPLDVSQIRR